jgi:enamine deaminase RidA (YjgF/YER057c/UK114 family)
MPRGSISKTKNTAARKKALTIKGLPRPSGVWSNAVLAKPGRLLFISGLVARDSEGKMVGVNDIEAQTRQVCDKLKQAVESVGGTLADIVRVDVYITDMAHFSQIHKVRAEYFPTDPPASTMVEVTRFVAPEAMIEINAIAVLP